MSDVSPLPQNLLGQLPCWDLLLGFSKTQGHSHIPRRKGRYFFIFFSFLWLSCGVRVFMDSCMDMCVYSCACGSRWSMISVLLNPFRFIFQDSGSH